MPAKPKSIVTGIKSIDRKLARLPYKIQGRVVRPAMRAGVKVMAAAVKDEIKSSTHGTGLTAKSVKVRATPKRRIKKGQRSSTIAMEVVVEANAGLVKTTKAGKRYFYPAIVEYGSRFHKPNQFGHRAFNRRGDAARRVTIGQLKAGAAREIKAL